jgi:hypothetical protein
MWYELWDTESRNLVESFDSEQDSLAAAIGYASQPGAAGVAAALALATRTEDTTIWLGSGAQLLKRAREAAGPPARRA